MADFVAKVRIGEIIKEAGYDVSANFEHVYSQIHSAGKQDTIQKLDSAIRQYSAV